MGQHWSVVLCTWHCVSNFIFPLIPTSTWEVYTTDICKPSVQLWVHYSEATQQIHVNVGVTAQARWCQGEYPVFCHGAIPRQALFAK